MNYFPNRLMADNRQRVPLGTSVSEDRKMSVTEFNDGTFDIEWDETDPALSLLNDWTEDDFIETIKQAAEEEISKAEEKD
jgi:hypothetical protein